MQVELGLDGEAEIDALLKQYKIDNRLFEDKLKNLIEQLMQEAYDQGFSNDPVFPLYEPVEEEKPWMTLRIMRLVISVKLTTGRKNS